jgi:hypothetical protein
MTSWRPPDTEDVPCPEVMKPDPAWDESAATPEVR